MYIKFGSYFKIIFGLIIIHIHSCIGNDNNFNIQYIKKGCIPDSIRLIEPLFGGFIEKYNYMNDRLQSINSGKVEYCEGRIYKAWFDDKRFETYYYDDNNLLIKCLKYTVSSKGKCNLDAEFSIEYKNGLISSYKNITSKDSTSLVYDNHNNIINSSTFNSKKTKIEEKNIKYDTSNNIFFNLSLPIFGFIDLLENYSPNNIIELKIVSYRTLNNCLIFKETYSYNEFNFPDTIKSESNTGFNSMKIIKYKNCQ